MNKYLSKLLLFLLLIIFLLPLTTQAQFVEIKNPLEVDTFEQLIDALVNIIFILAIAIAPIMFIVAGFYFVTAAGDPAKIKTAKGIILWTLIGLLIVFSAKGIIVLFVKIFGVKTPYNP